jgi:hypothetical protein
VNIGGQMDAEVISVSDIGQQLGRRKQSIFKVLRRLQIKPIKRRDASKGNQLVSFITLPEAERVRAECLSRMQVIRAGEEDSDDVVYSTESGVFYLIQLEPEHDPGRFKVGFAASIVERLRQHRCSAPFATTLRKWPCRRSWERAAIDCVTFDCEQIHTEVFRTDSIESVIARGEAFFKMMPRVEGETDDKR